jgi:anaerobic ribonucleoside-triphosphate reductase activating protein
MTELALSRVHFPVRALGPGQRVGIWMQGCSIRCPGCISLDTWTHREGLTSVAAVLSMIEPWVADADGLTVSGGEPLDQPDALRALLLGWKTLSLGDVLLFTGRDWQAAEPWMRANRGLVDAVIAGPYRPISGTTLALRGSDNQTLHILSDKGERLRPYDRQRSPEDRQLDVMFDEDGSVWFAGIPEGDDFTRLRDVLVAQGHAVTTSSNSRVLAR